jgi:hypothetical protein
MAFNAVDELTSYWNLDIAKSPEGAFAKNFFLGRSGNSNEMQKAFLEDHNLQNTTLTILTNPKKYRKQ